MQFLEALQKIQLPDSWQTEAIRALRAGKDVVLDAPTGSGKTFVLEQCIKNGMFRRPVCYAAPTRALANDKFLEWKNRGWNVGIITGDITRNPEAPILVGTLEALHGRILRQNRRPALVAIDEYQWLGDPARGNHYEGFILGLDPEVQVLFMSGSVGNPGEVADWLIRIGRDVEPVRHAIRPVPLEEFDCDGAARRMPDSIEGFWARRLAGALVNDLGPILVFAPHRKEAERLARQAARELPPPRSPLQLTPEQEKILGNRLARLVENRVSFHHSGLTYAQRAGVIEPLAKAGQLRVVVSTLGLGSGINFSLRSVLITTRHYQVSGIQKIILPEELLQMAGRAGRRGIDERGYLLTSRDTPRLSEARPAPLRRPPALPWSWMLQETSAHADDLAHWAAIGSRLFSSKPVRMGIEETARQGSRDYPCGLHGDTARARLVRRKRRPSKLCRSCELRPECLQLDPSPTPVWEWGKLGLLDKQLRLTLRGRIVSRFLGPEGLAVAAIVEDRKYPLEDAILDLADVFGGERFCGDENRWAGRLGFACRKAYQRFSVEGWLQWGIPVDYGFGPGEILRKLLNREKRKGQLTTEFSGIGDIDRLLVEWTSLLRQIVSMPEDLDHQRWTGLKTQAREWLTLFPPPELPDLPEVPPRQKEPVTHRLTWRR